MFDYHQLELSSDYAVAVMGYSYVFATLVYSGMAFRIPPQNPVWHKSPVHFNFCLNQNYHATKTLHAEERGTTRRDIRCRDVSSSGPDLAIIIKRRCYRHWYVLIVLFLSRTATGRRGGGVRPAPARPLAAQSARWVSLRARRFIRDRQFCRAKS